MRQERTSGRGDSAGSVNPTRSKAERGTRVTRPLHSEQSPGRPLRWMATTSERTDRTPPTGRLTVIRPLTRVFSPAIPSQTAARPRDPASSPRLRGSGPQNRARDGRRCRGSRWRWRAPVGLAPSSPIPHVGSEGWRSNAEGRESASRAQTGPRHRQTRSENLLRRNGSPRSPLKTVRRSPGSYSARCAATESTTMSGKGMVRTLASVFGGPRYGTLP